MNIRLYHDSDSRPVGDYDFAKVCEIRPTYTFLVTQTNKRIITNLRVKVTLEDGDSVAEPLPGIEGIMLSGTIKPPKIKIKVAKNVNSTKQQSHLADTIKESGISKAVPRASEYPSNDSDEINRTRTRRGRGTAGHSRKQSGTLPFEAAGKDEDW